MQALYSSKVLYMTDKKIQRSSPSNETFCQINPVAHNLDAVINPTVLFSIKYKQLYIYIYKVGRFHYILP